MSTIDGLCEVNQRWWEGVPEGKPVVDWEVRTNDPARGHAAHPNSRFTVAAKQNPSYSKLADAPGGVPISAIVFGGRRRTLAPLVYQARNWLHGVLVGAGVASETTAAATDPVGVGRRHPMAINPLPRSNHGDRHGAGAGDRPSAELRRFGRSGTRPRAGCARRIADRGPQAVAAGIGRHRRVFARIRRAGAAVPHGRTQEHAGPRALAGIVVHSSLGCGTTFEELLSAALPSPIRPPPRASLESRAADAPPPPF